jgi:hypothetical protein
MDEKMPEMKFTRWKKYMEKWIEDTKIDDRFEHPELDVPGEGKIFDINAYGGNSGKKGYTPRTLQGFMVTEPSINPKVVKNSNQKRLAGVGVTEFAFHNNQAGVINNIIKAAIVKERGFGVFKTKRAASMAKLAPIGDSLEPGQERLSTIKKEFFGAEKEKKNAALHRRTTSVNFKRDTAR